MGSISPLPSGYTPTANKLKDLDGSSLEPANHTINACSNNADCYLSSLLNPKNQSQNKFGGGFASSNEKNVFRQFKEWLSNLFHKITGKKPEHGFLNDKNSLPKIKKKRNWKETLINTGIKIAVIGGSVSLAIAFRKPLGATVSKCTPYFIKSPAKRLAGWITHVTPDGIKQSCSNISDITCSRIDRISEKAPTFRRQFFQGLIKG